jgi:predicted RNA-binding Zn ribbon-like protein
MQEFRSGNGAAWLDLISTVSGRYRTTLRDDIDTTTSLRAWLRLNDLEPTGAVTAADVTATRDDREALHRLATARVRGEPLPAADVRRLNTRLGADDGIRLTGDRRLRRPATVGQALARLAREAARDLAGHGPGVLRACGDDTCASLFLDTTGRRRWCSDLSCGNRARVRAHRARAEG